MRRMAHELRANKNTETPTRLIFYDTETWPELARKDVARQRLRLGVACFIERPHGKNAGREEWLDFEDNDTLWDWIEDKLRAKTRTYLISHNQNFDWLIVDGFKQLHDRGFTVSKDIIDSDIFILKARRATATLQALDSFNWFKMSLEKMGEFIGLPKQSVAFSTVGADDLRKYCANDVDILMKVVMAWIKYIEDNDLGTFAPTITGQAFAAFRHRFMDWPIMIHTNEKAISLERSSYRGGRNECYYIGKVDGRISYLDFISLYPSVMAGHEYPTELIRIIDCPRLKDVLELPPGFVSILDADIRIKTPAIGLKAERLVFPVGEFRVTLTQPELEYVHEHGEILQPHRAAIYKSRRIFDRYVAHFYSARQEFKQQNNAAGDDMSKRMLNHLYGKFGQRVKEQTPLGNCPIDLIRVEDCFDTVKNQRFSVKYYNGRVIKCSSTPKESYHSFPAIASFVTAYGRMKLWDAIDRAGPRNVYYCDTDSVFVNGKGLRRLAELRSETELGKLQVKAQYRSATIRTLKDYGTPDGEHIKGVRKNAVMIRPGEYEQDRFAKINSMMRRGVLDAADIDTVRKVLVRKYEKGKVGEDGWITPLRLSLTSE